MVCKEGAQAATVVLWWNSRCRFLQIDLVRFHDKKTKSPFLNLADNFRQVLFRVSFSCEYSVCPLQLCSIRFENTAVLFFSDRDFLTVTDVSFSSKTQTLLENCSAYIYTIEMSRCSSHTKYFQHFLAPFYK